MKATTSIVLTESLSQAAQSSCKVLSSRSHLQELSLLSLKVALTACLFTFSFGWRRALLLESSMPEPSLPEPALVILLFQSASSTQRAQKATGHQRAKTLLGMPSWKASCGGRMTSVFYFSLVHAEIGENLWCFISFLWEAQLWRWPKHNLDIIIDL